MSQPGISHLVPPSPGSTLSSFETPDCHLPNIAIEEDPLSSSGAWCPVGSLEMTPCLGGLAHLMKLRSHGEHRASRWRSLAFPYRKSSEGKVWGQRSRTNILPESPLPRGVIVVFLVCEYIREACNDRENAKRMQKRIL